MSKIPTYEEIMVSLKDVTSWDELVLKMQVHINNDVSYGRVTNALRLLSKPYDIEFADAVRFAYLGTSPLYKMDTIGAHYTKNGQEAFAIYLSRLHAQKATQRGTQEAGVNLDV